MDLLDERLLIPEELGVTRLPRWDVSTFDLVTDSQHNAELGCELIDAIIEQTEDSSKEKEFATSEDKRPDHNDLELLAHQEKLQEQSSEQEIKVEPAVA